MPSPTANWRPAAAPSRGADRAAPATWLERAAGQSLYSSPMLATYVPPPPLSDFVELFWLSEGYVQPHARERLLPQGTVELIINLGGETSRVYRGADGRPESFRGPLVSGPHSGFFAIDTAQALSVLGVHFRPGGAFPFFRPPAGELHDAHVALDVLWGP